MLKYLNKSTMGKYCPPLRGKSKETSASLFMYPDFAQSLNE